MRTVLGCAQVYSRFFWHKPGLPNPTPNFRLHNNIKHLIHTASNSFNAETCSLGTLTSCAVCLVRFFSLVHTCRSGISASLKYRAKEAAYKRPLTDKFASPPIFPKVLFSLSPCCNKRKRNTCN